MLLIPYARTNSSPWGRLCTSLAPHMDGLSLPLPRGMQHCPRPAARGQAMVPRAGEVPPSVAGVSPEAGGAPPPVAGVSPEAGVPPPVLPWPPSPPAGYIDVVIHKNGNPTGPIGSLRCTGHTCVQYVAEIATTMFNLPAGFVILCVDTPDGRQLLNPSMAMSALGQQRCVVHVALRPPRFHHWHYS